MDKEKIVLHLVNTFNDGDQLHEAYKLKMKEILKNFSYVLLDELNDFSGDILMDIEKCIDKYVEQCFKPRE